MTLPDISILPIQKISVGNVFNSIGEISFALQNYHNDVNKLCRQYKQSAIVLHHNCIEKYQYMNKEKIINRCKSSMPGSSHRKEKEG